MYEQRDIEELDTYHDHILAMTKEGLISKSSIAAELAWRDEVISAYKERIVTLQALARSSIQEK